jgi:hypothetical protein
MRISGMSFKKRNRYVGPSNERVARVFKRFDDGMVGDFVGQIDIGRVLVQREARLAPARVCPHGDVRLQVGNDAIRTVRCLLFDSDEEEVDRVHETCVAARPGRRQHAAAESNKERFRKENWVD